MAELTFFHNRPEILRHEFLIQQFGDLYTNVDEEIRDRLVARPLTAAIAAGILTEHYLDQGQVKHELLEQCTKEKLVDLAKKYIDNCKVCAVLANVLHDKCIEENVKFGRGEKGYFVSVPGPAAARLNISPYDTDPSNPSISSVSTGDIADLLHEMRLDQK